MAYTVTLTDGQVFAVIPDGTINTDSSMILVGKNYSGYGAFLDENFIHLLENSANNIPPLQPLNGQLWWDTGSKVLKVYDGNSFKPISAAAASSTAPVNNAIGDLWYDTVNQQLNVWTGAAWLLVGPSYNPDQGKTGAVPATIIDLNGVAHVVVELYAGGSLVGIISKDTEFTPQTAINGFTTINPGIQLSTRIGTAFPQFTGTSTNSLALGGAPANVFLRNDINQTTTGSFGILNNEGLVVGSNGDFSVSVNGTNGDINIRDRQVGGNLTIFTTNSSGTQVPGIIMYGANSVVSIPNLEGGANANTQVGSLGVGTAASGTIGSIRATGEIVAYFSDDRLKTKLGSIESPLSKVNQLNGFYYELNDTAKSLGYTSIEKEVGVSAQEVQRVQPEAVAPAPISDQYLTVKYERLVPLLIEAIKELSAKVTELEAKVSGE